MLTILSELPPNKHGQAMVLTQCSCGSPPKPRNRSQVMRGVISSCGKCAQYSVSLGDQHGELTVIRVIAEQDEYGRYQALCQCSCGSDPVVVPITYLTTRRRTSCGNCEKPKPEHDLTGKVFGELTVLRPSRKTKGWWYLVQCSCGSAPKEVKGGALQSESIQSCGHCDELRLGAVFHGMEVVSYEGTNKFGKKLYRFRCPFCQKISRPLIGSQVVAGKTRSCGCQRGKQAKENNRKARLRHGCDPEQPVTPAQRLLHLSATDIKKWVREVRDDFTCQLCGKRGVSVEAHHVYPVVEREDLVCDDRFLITLCSGTIKKRKGSCHDKAHNGNTAGPVDPEIQKVLLEILKNKYSQPA